ncbi:beta-galactosidase [Halobacillus mangrovi]|uniref:beta-galactosidase n=1 Tax=Halobacillus mangrovi TaxID=402384 RepID=UPI003D98B528
MINGKETILFGAELHYFRVPKQEWRNRLKDVKEAGINMISTYVPWQFHEIEEGYIDLTGETRGERDFQSFLQMVAEEGLYCLVRPGPYVMAEIIDHGVPTWFIENYPKAVALTEKGDKHATRVVSYLHPIYLEKVKNWYESVCSVIQPYQVDQGGPVILFQLDNEVGMFHWVTHQGDFNEVTVKQFQQYLEEKRSLSANDHTYFENVYKSGDTIQPLPVELKNDYFLFMREHYRAYLEHLKQLALELGITVPFVINIHGFHTTDFLKRGTMYPIGISQLLEAAKMEDTLVAGDYYIGNIEYDNYIDIVLANAFTKAIQSPDQPLFSAEFQGGNASYRPKLQPSTFDLTTRLCFANGMNAVNYYMFVGGENYEGIGLNGRRHEWQAPLTASGEKKPHFQVIGHLGKMFQTFEKPLLEAKQTRHTCFAFYPDYYMTDYSNHFSSPLIETFQRERDLNIFNGMAKGLRVNNIVFNSLNVQEDGKIDVGKVPTLWMFSMKWMDPQVQQKLVDYLEDGGKLVLFPTIPTRDLNDQPFTLLKEYIQVESKDRKSGFVRAGDIDSVKVPYMETFKDEKGAFAWSEDEAEDVVAFEKEVGKGRLFVFGAALGLNFNHEYDVIRELAQRVGVKSDFELEEELDISIRAISEKSYFIFLHNFDEYRKETPVYKAGQPLFEGSKVSIPSKSGLMLPVNIPIRDDVTITYGTAEVFNVEETADALRVKVKLKQAEDVFRFISSTWRPLESPGIIVDNEAEDTFHVTLLRSLEEEATIDFEKFV